MINRYLFGAAALLLAVGGATYFSTGAERAGERVRRDSGARKQGTEPVEPSPQEDSFQAIDPPASAPSAAPVELVAAAPAVEPVPPLAEQASAEEPRDPEPTSEQRAQLIRLPVISAIRGSHPDAAARYRAMREALARSGPSSEPWTRSASTVFENWSAALPKGLVRSLEASGVRCFLAGCEVEVRFEDRAAYEQAAEAFRSIPEENPAHGGRVQTPPLETSPGSIVASWMMLRPNVAPPDE